MTAAGCLVSERVYPEPVPSAPHVIRSGPLGVSPDPAEVITVCPNEALQPLSVYFHYRSHSPDDPLDYELLLSGMEWVQDLDGKFVKRDYREGLKHHVSLPEDTGRDLENPTKPVIQELRIKGQGEYTLSLMLTARSNCCNYGQPFEEATAARVRWRVRVRGYVLDENDVPVVDEDGEPKWDPECNG